MLTFKQFLTENFNTDRTFEPSLKLLALLSKTRNNTLENAMFEYFPITSDALFFKCCANIHDKTGIDISKHITEGEVQVTNKLHPILILNKYFTPNRLIRAKMFTFLNSHYSMINQDGIVELSKEFHATFV